VIVLMTSVKQCRWIQIQTLCRSWTYLRKKL